MAEDQKVSEMTPVGDLAAGDIIPVVRAGANAASEVPTGSYAKTTVVTAALATKADATATTAALNTKADSSAVTSALALKANLAGAQTFSGGQRSAVTAVTSAAASTAVDLALNNDFSTTLSENTTIANPTNQVAGQSGRIRITNGASAFTVAYGPNWKFPGGTVPEVTDSAGAIDVLYYDVLATGTVLANLIKGVA